MRENKEIDKIMYRYRDIEITLLMGAFKNEMFYQLNKPLIEKFLKEGKKKKKI